jgi:hypothetical protein
VSGLADEPNLEDVLEQIRAMKLSQFLFSTAVTIASLAFGKLEAKELDEARLGIDALGALVPLLGEDAQRDLGHTLTNLRLAYAAAVPTDAPSGE